MDSGLIIKTSSEIWLSGRIHAALIRSANNWYFLKGKKKELIEANEAEASLFFQLSNDLIPFNKRDTIELIKKLNELEEVAEALDLVFVIINSQLPSETIIKATGILEAYLQEQPWLLDHILSRLLLSEDNKRYSWKESLQVTKTNSSKTHGLFKLFLSREGITGLALDFFESALSESHPETTPLEMFEIRNELASTGVAWSYVNSIYYREEIRFNDAFHLFRTKINGEYGVDWEKFFVALKTKVLNYFESKKPQQINAIKPFEGIKTKISPKEQVASDKEAAVQRKVALGVWSNCLEIIKDNVSKQSFKTWFEPIRPVELKGNVLIIQVPSQFFYEWLEEHYMVLLRKTVKRILGDAARLEYRILVENSLILSAQEVIENPKQSLIDNQNPELGFPYFLNDNQIKSQFIIPGLKKINVVPQLNANYNFESLVEGDCNRLARSAGYAVSQKPGGTAFNPLVIYGGVGLGKTHLAQAIGNEVKANLPNKTVLYVSSEKFTNQFFDAVKNNSVNNFVHFYQLIDVLLVDDIQFLGNKEKTQDIFFHIFNHLHQNGKQLVLTTDRPPRDLEGMEERLLSRFKWGLSADLQVPDFETRIAILEKKMYADGIELPREVVEFIAYNINTNVRELEAALISVLAQASLNDKEVDLDLTKKIIKNFVKSISREVSIDYIERTVCDYFSINVDVLREKTRKRMIVQARQLSMFLATNYTKNSLKVIGKHFGGRDHSTVIHSCQAVQNLIDTDNEFREAVNDIQKKIQLSIS